MTETLVTVRQAGGWWPNLLDVSCRGCGWTERVNLNEMTSAQVERVAKRHVCDETS